MTLISLNCSGESIEKAIALYCTAYESNPDFYDSFDKVLIFFSENLPKKNKYLQGINGTFSCFELNWMKIFSEFDFSLFENNNSKVELLREKNLISDRVAKKLLFDTCRLDRILINAPSDILCADIYYKITKKFLTCFSNVSLVKLPVIDMLPVYIEYNYGYDGHSKIYALQPDGVIGVFYLGNMGKIKQFNMIERISRAICLSPNIYVYILMIELFAKRNIVGEYYIGYRPMKRFRRPSYDLAIKRLNAERLIIEPSNTAFSSILDLYSRKLSVEERSNYGIIQAFNNFLCI